MDRIRYKIKHRNNTNHRIHRSNIDNNIVKNNIGFYSKKFLSKNRILFLSIFVSLLGILFLFIFSGLVNPKFTSIEKLYSYSDGDYVSFMGYLKQIRETAKYYSLVVCETQSSSLCITVLVSKSEIPNDLVKGKYIFINGTVKIIGDTKLVSVSNLKDISVIDSS